MFFLALAGTVQAQNSLIDLDGFGTTEILWSNYLPARVELNTTYGQLPQSPGVRLYFKVSVSDTSAVSIQWRGLPTEPWTDVKFGTFTNIPWATNTAPTAIQPNESWFGAFTNPTPIPDGAIGYFQIKSTAKTPANVTATIDLVRRGDNQSVLTAPIIAKFTAMPVPVVDTTPRMVDVDGVMEVRNLGSGSWTEFCLKAEGKYKAPRADTVNLEVTLNPSSAVEMEARASAAGEWKKITFDATGVQKREVPFSLLTSVPYAYFRARSVANEDTPVTFTIDVKTGDSPHDSTILARRLNGSFTALGKDTVPKMVDINGIISQPQVIDKSWKKFNIRATGIYTDTTPVAVKVSLTPGVAELQGSYTGTDGSWIPIKFDLAGNVLYSADFANLVALNTVYFRIRSTSNEEKTAVFSIDATGKSGKSILKNGAVSGSFTALGLDTVPWLEDVTGITRQQIIAPTYTEFKAQTHGTYSGTVKVRVTASEPSAIQMEYLTGSSWNVLSFVNDTATLPNLPYISTTIQMRAKSLVTAGNGVPLTYSIDVVDNAQKSILKSNITGYITAIAPRDTTPYLVDLDGIQNVSTLSLDTLPFRAQTKGSYGENVQVKVIASPSDAIKMEYQDPLGWHTITFTGNTWLSSSVPYINTTINLRAMSVVSDGNPTPVTYAIDVVKASTGESILGYGGIMGTITAQSAPVIDSTPRLIDVDGMMNNSPNIIGKEWTPFRIKAEGIYNDPTTFKVMLSPHDAVEMQAKRNSVGWTTIPFNTDTLIQPLSFADLVGRGIIEFRVRSTSDNDQYVAFSIDVTGKDEKPVLAQRISGGFLALGIDATPWLEDVTGITQLPVITPAYVEFKAQTHGTYSKPVKVRVAVSEPGAIQMEYWTGKWDTLKFVNDTATLSGLPYINAAIRMRAKSLVTTGSGIPLTYSIDVVDDATLTSILRSHIAGSITATANSIMITVVDKGNALCSDSSGYIDINVEGGSGTYTFGGGFEGLHTGSLPAGNYTGWVSDGSDTTYKFFTIGVDVQPLTVLPAVKQPTCANNDGEISVAVAGYNGTEPQYYWSNGATSHSIGALSAGEYTLTIVDTACPARENYTAKFTLLPTFNTLQAHVDWTQNPACPDSTGAIAISVMGGNGQYNYEWLNESGAKVDSIEDPRNLPAGTYSVKITTDTAASVCALTLDKIVLTDPNKLQAGSAMGLDGTTLSYRNGEFVPSINLGKSLPGNVGARWTSSSQAIGIAASGTVEIPGFWAKYDALNPANDTVTITYKVAYTDGTPCPIDGDSGAFRIIITDHTVQDLDLIAAPVLSQTKCYNDAFDDITFSAQYVKQNAPAIDPNDVLYLVEFVGGTDVLNGDSLGFTKAAWKIGSIPDSSRTTGTGTYRVTPRWNNLEGKPVLLALTVLPRPTVDPIPFVALCDNSPLLLTFTGPTENTQFDWQANVPAAVTGMPAFGTNNINTNEIANLMDDKAYSISVTVIPRLQACADSTAAMTFNIYVLPTPSVDLIPNQVVKSGDQLPSITPTGVATSFLFYNDNPSLIDTVSGEIRKGGEFPRLDAVNPDPLQSPAIAKITLTPKFAFPIPNTVLEVVCRGEPIDFYVMVASRPTVSAISSDVVCEGEIVQPITPGGLPSGGANYITWSGGAPIGLADNDGSVQQVRSIPEFTAQAPTLTGDTTVTITVVSCVVFSGQKFSGDSVRYKITVSPRPRLLAGYEDLEINVETLTPCSDEPINLKVPAKGGNLQYQWYKDHQPIAGATDSTLSIARADVGDAGLYYAIVRNSCAGLQSRSTEVSVRLNVIKQLWNDMIVLNCDPNQNGGYTFSSPQWYKDSVPISAENRTFYYEPGGLAQTSQYYVTALTQAGDTYVSCPLTPQAMTAANHVSVFPNPVGKGEEVSIELPSGTTANRVQILSTMGQVLATLPFAAGQKVRVPDNVGIYLIVIWSGDAKIKTIPIIVK